MPNCAMSMALGNARYSARSGPGAHTDLLCAAGILKGSYCNSTISAAPCAGPGAGLVTQSDVDLGMGPSGYEPRLQARNAQGGGDGWPHTRRVAQDVATFCSR